MPTQPITRVLWATAARARFFSSACCQSVTFDAQVSPLGARGTPCDLTENLAHPGTRFRVFPDRRLHGTLVFAGHTGQEAGCLSSGAQFQGAAALISVVGHFLGVV